MAAKIKGFKGKKGYERALEASSNINPNPWAWQLKDGSWVGGGQALLTENKALLDYMLVGAYGTTCLCSKCPEFERDDLVFLEPFAPMRIRRTKRLSGLKLGPAFEAS